MLIFFFFGGFPSKFIYPNVAVGVRPGEEVIVPPYTFTSTATSVLMNNGIPVFSDIDSVIYCLDPKKLEEHITEKTRAVISQCQGQGLLELVKDPTIQRACYLG